MGVSRAVSQRRQIQLSGSLSGDWKRPRPSSVLRYWSSQLQQSWKADSGARVPVSRQKFSYRGVRMWVMNVGDECG